MALEAAEIGHLVLVILHTSSAAVAVHRVVDQFPAKKQAQMRTQLAVFAAGGRRTVLSQAHERSWTRGSV